ncbi:MAG TPA: serine/threonine-protein kinase [Terriglobales bacterium]|jgi:eukaryotic-like serine/threonine-protein kinase|nr:serine/threonine-protein kinase [Terriglobales bacterium]
MDDRTSERFGRYEILSELGRGAMGVVYKARDPKINRIVAVKTISLAGQPPEEEREYRERFLREAEAAGRVSHPGIVTIFDVGEEPETRAPYIVMELVSGEPLDKVLSKDERKLAVETALKLALELAEALDCAHRQGVVHRDLKPANILMTEDGHAKIADFGVAKLNLSNQTLAGRALGTPAYMSPEQLNGEAVDGRSDLFSLGVILYTVLTGHRPFQGNSATTVSFKVVNHDPIPATLLDTELPEGLDHIIARAMAKNPAERYQRGAEMALDIRNLQEGRKPANKAKYASSPAGGSASQTAQTAKEGRSPALGQPVLGQPALGRLGLGHPWIAAELLSIARTLRPGVGETESPLEKLRKASFAGVLVLTGLFILALWVISLGPQGVRPRAAEAVAPAKTAAAPLTAPTANVAAPAHAPVAKKLPTPRPPHRTDSPPVKVARASLPAASSAAAPAVSPVVSRVVTPAVSPATLEIEVDHKFAEAYLSIWVDDTLTYTRVLEGTDKKHLVVFHHVQGHALHAMQVSPGKHRLRVQVTSGSDADAPAGVPKYDQSAFVDGEFTSGQENVLSITFNKHGEINLSLQ